jgi:NADH dehydrogenase
MTVCVTGAAGFIGSALSRRLVQEGHSVVAFSRRAPRLPSDRVVLHTGDIRDPRALDRIVAGTDAVVHLAAVTSEGSGDKRTTDAVNVEGTRSLAAACRRGGVRQVVYLGTLSSLRPCMGNYGASKAEAERILGASGLDVTIIRPHLVYGPGEQGLFAKLVRLIRRSPVVPVLGSGRHVLQPVHVDDVVESIVRSLGSPQAVGNGYNLVGPDSVTMNRFVDMVCEALSRRCVRVNIPYHVALALAHAFSLVTKNPPFTLDNLIGMNQDITWSSEEAVRDLGYRPRPLAVGLREAIAA